jgi:hypothetical protein
VAGREPALLLGILARFWLGAAGAVAAGWLAFRDALFEPGGLQFQGLTIGALAAGVVTLVRVRHPGTAMAVATAYAVLTGALAPVPGLRTGIAALLVGGGIVLSALVFHEVSRAGFRFGKFLVLGSLVGGVCVAVAPVAEFSGLALTHAAGRVVAWGVLGIVVGNGVGVGIEIAELLPGVDSFED